MCSHLFYQLDGSILGSLVAESCHLCPLIICDIFSMEPLQENISQLNVSLTTQKQFSNICFDSMDKWWIKPDSFYDLAFYWMLLLDISILF